MSATETRIPTEHFNAELRKIGRRFEDADARQEWRGAEFGLRLLWPDGRSEFVGFGPTGTAMVEKWLAGPTGTH